MGFNEWYRDSMMATGSGMPIEQWNSPAEIERRRLARLKLCGARYRPDLPIDDVLALPPDDYHLVNGHASPRPLDYALAEAWDRGQDEWRGRALVKAAKAAIAAAAAIQEYYPKASISIAYDESCASTCPPYSVRIVHFGPSPKKRGSLDLDPMLQTD